MCGRIPRADPKPASQSPASPGTPQYPHISLSPASPPAPRKRPRPLPLLSRAPLSLRLARPLPSFAPPHLGVKIGRLHRKVGWPLIHTCMHGVAETCVSVQPYRHPSYLPLFSLHPPLHPPRTLLPLLSPLLPPSIPPSSFYSSISIDRSDHPFIPIPPSLPPSISTYLPAFLPIFLPISIPSFLLLLITLPLERRCARSSEDGLGVTAGCNSRRGRFRGDGGRGRW